MREKHEVRHVVRKQPLWLLTGQNDAGAVTATVFVADSPCQQREFCP
jgi:hypothetical protein